MIEGWHAVVGWHLALAEGVGSSFDLDLKEPAGLLAAVARAAVHCCNNTPRSDQLLALTKAQWD